MAIKRILTFDLGMKTGYAFGLISEKTQSVLDARQDSGTKCFETNKRFQGGGYRYLMFNNWLNDMFAMYTPNEVWFEAVHAHKGTAAAHIYGALSGMLMVLCEKRSIPYNGVPVATIKKQISGKGNTNKDGMLLAMEKFLPKKFSGDDNEVDAIAILQMACVTYTKQI